MDKWIYEPPSESEDDFKTNDSTFMLPGMSHLNDTSLSASPAFTRGKKGKKKRKGAKGEEEEDENGDEMKRVSLY